MINPFKTKISEAETSLLNLQEQFDSLNTQFESVRTELVEATERNSTLNDEFIRVSEEKKSLVEQLETLKAEIVEVSRDSADFEQVASDKAVAIVANLGVPAVEITEETEDDESDIIAQFKSLKGAEAQAFYNLNKQAIHQALKN